MSLFKRLPPKNKYFFLRKYLSHPSLLSQEDIRAILDSFPFKEHYKEHNLNYLALKLLREVPSRVDLGLLSRKLGIKRETAAEILKNPCIEIKFPIAKEGKAFLNELMVIPLKSGDVISTENLKKEELITLKKLTGKGFFLGFRKLFSSESSSYTLALYVALTYGRTFSSMAFTGRISPEGRIEEVEHLTEKIDVCKREGIPLLYPHEGQMETLQDLHLFLSSPEVPVYIFPSGEDGKRLFYERFSLSEEYFGTVFHINSPLNYTQAFKEEKAPESFGEFAKWLREVASKLKKIKDNFLPHLTVGITSNPLVFSFLAGVMFSKNRLGVRYYKYFKDGKSYSEIYTIKDDRDIPSPEKVKDLVSVYKSNGDSLKISVRDEENPKGILIKIPSGDVLDRNVKEIAYHVNSIIRSLEDKTFKLILEAPNDFAFALGYFLEDYKPLVLTHKEKSVYVLKRENRAPYYLVNAFSLNMLSGKRHIIEVEELSLEEVKNRVEKEGFQSFISHRSTAQVLTKLLGTEVEYRRENLILSGGERLIVFQLGVRPKEGQLLSEVDLDKILARELFKFFLVRI